MVEKNLRELPEASKSSTDASASVSVSQTNSRSKVKPRIPEQTEEIITPVEDFINKLRIQPTTNKQSSSKKEQFHISEKTKKTTAPSEDKLIKNKLRSQPTTNKKISSKKLQPHISEHTEKAITPDEDFEDKLQPQLVTKKSSNRKSQSHIIEQTEEIITPEDFTNKLQLRPKASKKDTKGRSGKIQSNEQTNVKSSVKSAVPKTSNSQKQKLTKPACDQQQHKLTEYFPIRRSVRKPEKLVLEEKQRELETKVLDGIEDGLEITTFEGKGRGVTATRSFSKGEFVVEYAGELIDGITAKEREAKYSEDKNIGCYMFYFRLRNQQYCIDATSESGKLGRLVNHSKKGNLTTKIVEINNTPHLVLMAKEYVKSGTEFCYDYGDRNPESLKNHPWLAL